MILVGYDGSKQASAAVRWAARISAVRLEALQVLSAVPMPVVPGAEFMQVTAIDEFVGGADKLAEEGAVLARAAGAVDVSGLGVTTNPARALVEASESASLVVVGNRGHHQLVETVLGSVGYAIASHAACPAVIIRGESDMPLRRVVVAHDGSEPADRAVAFAAAAAASVAASLHIVGAWLDVAAVYGLPVHDGTTEVAEVIHQDLQDARSAVLEKYPDLEVTTEVARGEAAVEIARIAQGAGLLVAGSRGRGGFRSLLLGSVSRHLVTIAPCPVAVIR